MKHNKKKKRAKKNASPSKKLAIAHITLLSLIALVDLVFAFADEWIVKFVPSEFLFLFFWAGWVVLIPLLFFITIGAWIACKIKKKEFFKPCKIALLADLPVAIFTFLAYCAFF